jgi:hypothetical protein
VSLSLRFSWALLNKSDHHLVSATPKILKSLNGKGSRFEILRAGTKGQLEMPRPVDTIENLIINYKHKLGMNAFSHV